MEFFYIQNRKMCFSKKFLNQYFVVFCPAWDSFSSEKTLWQSTKNLKKIYNPLDSLN